MGTKQLRIFLGKDGSVRSNAIGFIGPECEEKAEFIKKVFGEPTETKRKDSYYAVKEAIADGLPEGHCG